MTTDRLLRDLNLRDLGGLPVADGRRLRPGLVYRAGALSRLGDDARGAIDALGLRTIVDLRSPYERQRYGTSYTPPGARLVLLAMDSGDLTATLAPTIRRGQFERIPLDTLAQINRKLVRGAQPQLSVLMRLLASDERRPLLFHCSHGKDRTGLAAALILSAMGADYGTVLRDYLRSNDTPHVHNVAFRRRLARVAPILSRRPWRRPMVEPVLRLLSVDPENLSAAWDEMQGISDGVEGFLQRRLGLDEERRDALRAALLA